VSAGSTGDGGHLVFSLPCGSSSSSKQESQHDAMHRGNINRTAQGGMST
jgi:hypothetical protein